MLYKCVSDDFIHDYVCETIIEEDVDDADKCSCKLFDGVLADELVEAVSSLKERQILPPSVVLITVNVLPSAYTPDFLAPAI